ncbi:MAG: dihydrodipicolinate synthase family protein [Lentisphaerae bacterium]|nr:dihydrodipicolinate synthase family protein [Lentisphaerota bacterium]
MNRLTADTLHGIWAGVTLAWDDAGAFDEAAYSENTRALCDAGVHGIYTTGSTGEFYALSFEEFKRMVDIQCDLCGAQGMPLQIGCCSDNTSATLRLLEYAAGKPAVGAAQVALPYWMELTDRELLQFFKDLHSACPALPLVHYNIPRAKRFLHGSDYLRILEVAPSLIGVKYTFAGSHFAELQESLLLTPRLAYFVAENLLASAMLLGARGSCSSLVCTDPAYMLTFYDHAVNARWEKASAMQQTIQRFFTEIMPFVAARGEGMIDPVFDKGLAKAAGFLAGSQRTRAPYIGWSDATVMAVREWLRAKYPMFLHPACRT